MDAYEKMHVLRRLLRSLDSVVIAFSGGVDSSFLLKVAHDVLGKNVLGVTARSVVYPEREFRHAVEFAREHGIPHAVVASNELEIEGFSDNPPDRCYLCKTELLKKMWDVARERNMKCVAEGSNHDDLGDYRPGLKAVAELHVLSPLREAMLTKQEIRHLSKEMGLRTWNKPSFACLSTRFPYGEKLTREKMQMVDSAEQYLLDSGFSQVRVRHHGDIARIELVPEEMAAVFHKGLTSMIYDYFRSIGFPYAALDLRGYRTGSMDEGLFEKQI
ncbi:MAG: ATP-dependent sacrificial sulfur transferase LarE [Ignavibacteriales bacterium]